MPQPACTVVSFVLHKMDMDQKRTFRQDCVQLRISVTCSIAHPHEISSSTI